MQNARVIGQGRLRFRFQKRGWETSHCAPEKAFHEIVRKKTSAVENPGCWNSQEHGGCEKSQKDQIKLAQKGG